MSQQLNDIPSFKEAFEPFQKNFIKTKITEETKVLIHEFATQMTSAKSKEEAYKRDGKSKTVRWTTGPAGELAVQAILKTPFVDLTIGESKSYNHADLRSIGLNVGVKTVRYGLFPMVPISPTRPEIIVIRKEDRFYICGVATVETMKKYSSQNLIKDPNAFKENRKTGFYGFDKVLPFRTLKELKEILNAAQ